jgi:hypothetical protein
MEGDVLEAVDHFDITGLAIQDIRHRIMGKSGVNLSFLRERDGDVFRYDLELFRGTTLNMLDTSIVQEQSHLFSEEPLPQESQRPHSYSAPPHRPKPNDEALLQTTSPSEPLSGSLLLFSPRSAPAPSRSDQRLTFTWGVAPDPYRLRLPRLPGPKRQFPEQPGAAKRRELLQLLLRPLHQRPRPAQRRRPARQLEWPVAAGGGGGGGG